MTNKRIAYNRSNTKEFIEKAKKVFPNFNYSKVNYVTTQVKVIIICPKHGDFLKNPADLLNRSGCPNCKKEISSKTGKNNLLKQEDVISRFQLVHNNYYSYENTIYISTKEKLRIDCPKHGAFYQLPGAHANGQGCPKCGLEKQSDSAAKTVEKSIKNSKRRKDILLPSGSIISVQGHEPYMIDILLGQGYKEIDILTRPSQMPLILYTAIDNKIRKYIPDIFIPKENRIIEIKSTFTAKLDQNLNLKMEASKNLNLTVDLVIINKNQKLKHVKILDITTGKPKEKTPRKQNSKEHNLAISKALSTPIHCIELNRTFSSCKEAAEFVGLKYTSDIHQIAKGIGKSRTAGGYTWRYVNKN